MNSLVAQYSRPAYRNEGYSEQEQDEISQTTPPLSLRFAMPPLANVSPVQLVHRPLIKYTGLIASKTADPHSLPHSFALSPMTTRIQTAR